jgi:tetratricopeptide (TPR) repeat protein
MSSDDDRGLDGRSGSGRRSSPGRSESGTPGGARRAERPDSSSIGRRGGRSAGASRAKRDGTRRSDGASGSRGAPRRRSDAGLGPGAPQAGSDAASGARRPQRRRSDAASDGARAAQRRSGRTTGDRSPDPRRAGSSQSGRDERQRGGLSDRSSDDAAERRRRSAKEERRARNAGRGVRNVRPPETRREPRVVGPPIPDDITGQELAPEVRKELSSLSKERAEFVARHLVMAGQLLDEEPETAYQHAVAARARGARLGVAREANAIAAYRTGRYDEALAEFRALRRITGSNEYWPAMADCERGLGRPQRAIEMGGAPEAATLDAAGRAELRLVVAGARRDLGQYEAALVTLRVPELTGHPRPWSARLRYAYADTLLDSGDVEGAKEWFLRTADIDPEDETGAAERLVELGGAEIETDGSARGAADTAGEPEDGPARI